MEINLAINFPSNNKEPIQIPKSLKISYLIDFNNSNNKNMNNNDSNSNKNIITLNLKNIDNNKLVIIQEDNKNINNKNKTDNRFDANSNFNQNNIINKPEIYNKNELSQKDNNNNNNKDNDLWESDDNRIKNKNEKELKNKESNSRERSINSNIKSKKSFDNKSNIRSSYDRRERSRESRRDLEKINYNNNIMIPSDTNEELFITGIRDWMTDTNIKESFSKYGEIEYIKTLKDRKTNRNKGTGFIKFKEKKSAFLAMMDANNIFCKGKSLKIRYNNKIKGNKKNKDFERKSDENIKSCQEFNNKDSYFKDTWGSSKKKKYNKNSVNRNNKEDSASNIHSYRERSRENDKDKNNNNDDDW